jgi:60 kDa SS-A/Ro ribonucleoprotein
MFFNTKVKTPVAKPIVNHAGGQAFAMTPEMELYSAVVTSTLSDQYYEKGGARLERIKVLIRKCDPHFVAQLAVYAREQMHMRTMPLVLVVELAKIHAGDDLVRRLTNRVIQRADELTEILACYAMANQRKGAKTMGQLSKQLQRGVADAFNKFDAYQFAKYNRKGQVTLRDALFLTHPKAKSEDQQALFNKIVNNTLETPYTWETELSALGQQAFEGDAQRKAAFKAKWEELIASGQLGYMAMLRNLRNIIEAEVSGQYIQKVCDTLSDAQQVAKSKQFPFRFLAAFREIKEIESQYTTAICAALEQAVSASIVNIKGFDFDTRVTIACDVSGSMQKPVSAKSKVLLYDIGLMMGMMLLSKCKNAQAGMFGDKWKTVSMSSRNILTNVQEFYRREGEVGYSTNGYLVIQDLLNSRKVMDKVMLFTDCQLWNSGVDQQSIAKYWADYRRQVAPNAKLYLFDLAGHGQEPVKVMPENGVYLIAGWSDKVFDVLAALEDGQNAIGLIRKITI